MGTVWFAHECRPVALSSHAIMEDCVMLTVMRSSYRLVDAQASKRHCSGEAIAPDSVCHVTKQMINDFESSKKGFEKDTIDHMSSRELDLGRPVAFISVCPFVFIISCVYVHVKFAKKKSLLCLVTGCRPSTSICVPLKA